MSGFRIPGRLQYLSEDTGREVIELVADHAPLALSSAVYGIITKMPESGPMSAFEAGRRTATEDVARLRAALEKIAALSLDSEMMADEYTMAADDAAGGGA